FPPIGDTSLTSLKGTIGAMNLGNMVFKSVQFYFELTEQKRQNDQQYLQVLRNIRSQTVSQADLQFLHANCSLPPLETFDIESLLKTPVIVSTNEIRYNWNKKFTRIFSEYTRQPITLVESIDTIDCEPDALLLAELKQRMPDYLQNILHLVHDMPVMFVSRNLYKQLGVVNGGTGILRGVVCNSKRQIEALQIYIPPTQHSREWKIPGLPENTIYLKRVSTTESITLSNGKTFKLRRQQFPITESFAITDYKSQGQTFGAAIINLSDGRGVSTYIKLSRTKNAANTFLMDGYQLDDLKIEYPKGYKEWRVSYLEPGIVATRLFVSNITLFD
ncbi:hypothetical protein HDV02_005929, partial [Globomyces sp. JEL0801]